MELGIASVGAITVICYVIGFAIRTSPINSNFIPPIVAICGGLLGVAGFFWMQDFPAQDIITAIAVGIVSGLAATGINQMTKIANNTSNTPQNNNEETKSSDSDNTDSKG